MIHTRESSGLLQESEFGSDGVTDLLTHPPGLALAKEPHKAAIVKQRDPRRQPTSAIPGGKKSLRPSLPGLKESAGEKDELCETTECVGGLTAPVCDFSLTSERGP